MIPRIGFNVEYIEHRNTSLGLWDLGGQSKIRNLWRSYYSGGEAIIFVIDSTQKYRMDKTILSKDTELIIHGYIHQIQEETEFNIPMDLCDILYSYYYSPPEEDETDVKQELHQLLTDEYLYIDIFLILANKQDCADALTVNEIETILKLDKIKKPTQKIYFQGCSAITSEGIYEGLDFLVRALRAK